MDFYPARFQELQRRVDKTLRETLCRQQRPAELRPLEKGLTQDRLEQNRRGLTRGGVERRQGHRLPEPLIEQALSTSNLRHGFSRGGVVDPERRQVFRQFHTRDAAPFAQQPERELAGARAHLPAFPGPQIKKWKDRFGRFESLPGVNHRKIALDRKVAGKDQMIAVVDHRPQGLVQERTAPPAGVAGPLIKGHGDALPGQFNGSRQARHPGPDDMDPAHFFIRSHGAARPSAFAPCPGFLSGLKAVSPPPRGSSRAFAAAPGFPNRPRA